MSSGRNPPEESAPEEFSVLIKALREADQRLEELTRGEVDTVADREGRSFVLRRAQDQLREAEAARQTSILNALPAHIALLDTRGIIVSVNEAWRRFAADNALQERDFAIGLNYLDVCARTQGANAAQAEQVAAGIRSVLSGALKQFSIEYSCAAPTQQRWFALTVTPLADERLSGAVVMHVDVTTQRRIEESLRLSESRFRQMAEHISDVFFLQDLDSSQVYYVSPAYEQIWGRTCESLYADPSSWSQSIHPDDRERAYQLFTAGRNTGFDYEFRIVRPDGAIRWVHVRGFPIFDDAGVAYRTAGVVEDITPRMLTELDLRESERRFGDLLRNTDLASVMLDPEARITFCNDYLLRLTGWRHDEVIGKNWFTLFTPWDQGAQENFFFKLATASPATWSRESELVTRAGVRRLMRWNNSWLRSGAGVVIGSAGIGEDITERKRAEARIAYLNRVYAMLRGISTLSVRVRDRDELYREACRIAVEDGGFRMSLIATVDAQKQSITTVALVSKDEKLLSAMRAILAASAGAPSSMAARALRESKPIVSNDSQHDPTVRRNDTHATFGVGSMAIFPLIVADTPVAILALYANESEFFQEDEMKLLTELTSNVAFAIDHIEKQERLDYLAYYDVLTGLANRHLFLERVAQYIRSAVSAGHKLAVFLIDLERFKSINDSLGQAAGDNLLRQAAQWLTNYVGDANLATRVSADHFAVVLPEVSAAGDLASLIEHTMVSFLNHPFHLNDAVFRVAAKVGVAVFPDDGTDAGMLFKNAEAALKKAKACGERYLFYTPKMTESVAGKLTLENQLRQALEKQEFALYYQPKVDLASGKVTSAEALIRWDDPRTGLVLPGQFIPILEETGLIYEVGQWALHKAIDDFLRWRSAGLAPVRLAVNVSPLQLRNRGFIAQVEQAVGIDPHAAAGLELEITESLIMDDVKHNIAILQKIRAMGVTIAIDDFGTGFSSLSYLAKLPVHTLKIDRSFIIEMTTGVQGLAIVSTIIRLAHSLKLKVVAEGVETEDQSGILRVLKCNEMQGYLFSKPVSAEVFEKRFLTKTH